MSEVFYRKWRPQRLDQVVGQEAMAQTLRNAVAQGKTAHAYLFCGPRGTGKTSTARILAKAVNCDAPQSGEPDNTCESCVAINEGRALDLIEIDAASNRGIDDIRSLREKVHFAPSEARHKLYIVDEAHMLTEPAFNALLKTLEEPPPYAIFVLATTEVHKVPLTIISRCQRFDFRRIPLEAAEARLAKLCQDEGVEAAPKALAIIARSSAGSLRDAENLLEQALVSYGSPLNEDQVRDLLGLSSDEKAVELVGHVVGGAVKEGLGVINQVAGDGVDLRQFHRSLMEHLRAALLLKSGAAASLGYPDELKERLKLVVEGASMERLVRALNIFAAAELRRDSASPLPLELALVESSLSPAVPAAAPAPAAAASPAPAAPRASRAAPKIEPPAMPKPPSVSRPPPRANELGPPADEPHEKPSDPLQRLESQWESIVKSLRTEKGKRFNLAALLRSSTEREVEDGTITLKYSHTSHLERMQEELEDPRAGKVLRDAFAGAMEGPYEIRASADSARRNGPTANASQRSHLVRAARAMGATVVGEKEEERDDE